MRRTLVSLLVIGAALPHAAAKPRPSDDSDASDSDDTDRDVRPTRKAKAARPDDDGARSKAKAKADDGDSLQKQDLSGHDLGTGKKDNVFERDRFFVDKVDSDRTAQGTLIQGSLTSTSFGYHETGGTLAAPAGTAPGQVGAVPSASGFSRLFTDLRLQTDFRHIATSRWDARVDVRGRVVVMGMG